MTQTASAATAAANGTPLPAAFQMMTTWANELPDLCDAREPAGRAYQAAVALVAAERKQRRRAKLMTKADIKAAHMVLGSAEEIWNRLDARRRIYHPRSVSNFSIVDSLFVKRLSQRQVAKKYGLHLSTIQQRYQNAFKALDDALGHLCNTSDDPDPSTGCYNVIDGWRDRLRKLRSVDSLWAPERKRVRKRKMPNSRVACRPGRQRPSIDLWIGLSKAEKQQATDALVAHYLDCGGTITKCKSGSNYLCESSRSSTIHQPLFEDEHWERLAAE